MAASFLNADLEITSASPLEPLRDEIGERAWNMFCGPLPEGGYRATFEIDDEVGEHSAERLIEEFCALLQTLSPASRQLFDQATRRSIDLGYQVMPNGEQRMQTDLPPAILAQMHALGLSLALTIYQADPAELDPEA